MPSLPSIVADLFAKPRPVLCLDTCELLAAVQCLPQRRVSPIEALTRVLRTLKNDPDLAKQRPSHVGHIKDSIHLEHYLELARQLRAGGFSERCIFVSGNKEDFWEGALGSRVHPALQPELAAVDLEFYGNLRSALGSLGI